MAKIQDLEIDDYLASTVNIEPMALEEEFIRLPSDLAYWNERYAQAHRALAMAKLTHDQLEARLHMEARETLMGQAEAAATQASVKAAAEAEAAVAAGKKKTAAPAKASVKAPTVSDIASAVNQHPEIQAAKLALIDAEVEKTRLYGVIDAIRSKRDMLIQMGSRSRIEMMFDPQIREQMAVLSAQRNGMG